MTANKTRVQVRGTVGKSVRFPTDTGSTGATIGLDFRLPDGSVPTLQQLAAALVTGSAIQDQPGNIVPPGGGPTVIWQNIQYVPAPIRNPPRYVHAEEEAGEEYYRMAVPGPIGPRGLQGFPAVRADDPEDPMPGPPGQAGVAGAAGPPGAISAVHLWPDDPEDHISIPGAAGAAGATGSAGPPGAISAVHLWPDDAEDPGLIPGAPGQAGAAGPTGAPGVFSTVHLYPDDPEDPGLIPGAAGPVGLTGAQGPAGVISAVHLWPDDPEDSISIPGAAGAAGVAGAAGPPGAISAVHLYPDDAEDPGLIPGPAGPQGIQGPAGSSSSSAGVGWASYLDQDHIEDPITGTTINYAPPSASVGLTAVAGGAPSAMRSDAAPALSQGIIPTWTGKHTFNGAVTFTATLAASTAVSSIDVDVQGANSPRIRWTASAAAADTKFWEALVNSAGTFALRIVNDAYTVSSNGLVITRTGAAFTNFSIGNATDNPTYSFLGTGLTTHTGDVTVGAAARTGAVSLIASNTSIVDGDTARVVVSTGSSNVSLFMTDAAQSTAIVTGGPTGLQAVLRTLGAAPIVFGTSNAYRGQIDAAGLWKVPSSPLGSTITQVHTGLANFVASTTTRTSTTVLAAEAGLTVTCNEIGWYHVKIQMLISEATSGAGGFVADRNGGTATIANATFTAYGISAASGAATLTPLQNLTTTWSYATVAISPLLDYLTVEGYIQVSVAGTFGIRWAQNSSSANATQMRTGSYIKLTKIG